MLGVCQESECEERGKCVGSASSGCKPWSAVPAGPPSAPWPAPSTAWPRSRRTTASPSRPPPPRYIQDTPRHTPRSSWPPGQPVPPGQPTLPYPQVQDFFPLCVLFVCLRIPGQLCLRALNATKTAYFTVSFARASFDRFQVKPFPAPSQSRSTQSQGGGRSSAQSIVCSTLIKVRQ